MISRNTLKDKRARHWCFTINNPTPEELEKIKHLNVIEDIEKCIAELEHVNPEEGTIHIQGYVKFNRTIRGLQVKKNYLGMRAHIEIARGTEQQNWDYCSKEGKIIVSKGEPNLISYDKTEKEARIDDKYLMIIKDAREMKEDEFREKWPKFYINNLSFVNLMRAQYLIQHTDTWNGILSHKNLWIWGPAGTGKSRLARSGNISNHEIYPKNMNKWWDGFNPDIHKRVVLDDWAPGANSIQIKNLKDWMDRYTINAEVKNGHIAIFPSFNFIVTSNYPIEKCFENTEDQEAIRRRCSVVEWKGGSESLDRWITLQ